VRSGKSAGFGHEPAGGYSLPAGLFCFKGQRVVPPTGEPFTGYLSERITRSNADLHHQSADLSGEEVNLHQKLSTQSGNFSLAQRFMFDK
jgi:hypothetical protein